MAKGPKLSGGTPSKGFTKGDGAQGGLTGSMEQPVDTVKKGVQPAKSPKDMYGNTGGGGKLMAHEKFHNAMSKGLLGC